jgi:orotidine-5'-phosphate decarboxylase
MHPADPASAEAVHEFLAAVIDRLEGRVAVVKPQIALFEQLGWRGLQVLEALVTRAHERGLLVLLDAKRGDIGSTAEGYARAYLDPDAALPVDAITLNPYLGLDSLEPFVARAAEHGRGLFVLVKTSNPGSSDVQDRDIGGEPLFEALARSLDALATRLAGPATGFSSLGVVVGATYPEQAQRIRAALPQALFLVPGYGAQGASAKDAVRGFTAGPQTREGGIVNSSRAILYPEAAGSGDVSDWEKAFDAALWAAVTELREAINQ